MKKNIIEIFASHRVAANLLMALMFVSGLWAMININTQFLPNFDINVITVNISWPGASSEDIQKGITIPVEDELRNVDHLKKMTSRSRLGKTTITLEFYAKTNMNEALNQVKQRVDSVRDLPEDSEKPITDRIIRYESVARLIISGSQNIDALRPFIHRFERQLLNRGIAKVRISGLPKQEIAIQIPAKQLITLNLSLDQIAKLISNHSKDTAAGSIGKLEMGQELRSSDQRRSVQGFLNLPLLHDKHGRLIRLGDIAFVSKRARDIQTHISFQGKPAVEMTLLRTESGSALKSANILHDWLKDVKQTIPDSIKVIPYFESWKLIKERITLLFKNGFWGLLLILSVLFLFLNFRIALWVAIGIPASFLAAIAMLYVFHASINMVSLFAMIMTLGIVVDDTIVVGEEILVQLQQGTPLYQAVINGTQVMLAPVLASSLSTIATFIPLMVIGGIIGQVLFDIPLFTLCVIFASVIECFLVLPGHIYHSSKKIQSHEPLLNNIFLKFKENYFRKLVRTAIQHKWTTLSIAFVFILITITMLITGYIKFNFFPTPEGRRIYLNATFTPGTPTKTIKQFLVMLETSLNKTDQALGKGKIRYITAFTSMLNQSTRSEKSIVKIGERYVSMNIELISPEKRKLTNQQFIDAWKKNISLPSQLESFSITQLRAGPPGQDIHIELLGDNIHILKNASNALKKILFGVRGVSNVKDNLPFGKNNIFYQLTPQGHLLGLTTASVGRQLRSAFNGEIIQIYHDPSEEIEVRVMLPDNERYQTHILSRLPIITPEGKSVPLGSVVKLNFIRGFDEIQHHNTRLSVRVTADVDPDSGNANAILTLLNKKFLPNIKQTYNVNYHLSGRAEEQAETFHDMKYGLILAIVLLYIILAWVFSSYGWPILIMIAIPFGLMGAIWGHIIMGISLTILSLFGFFGLSGIVINDSIILLIRYRTLRNNGIAYQDAIVEAACQRLRAVLLTSLTTIAGLLPLLFERSLQARFLIPMAVSLVFGLIVTTVLILLLVPCMLIIYESRLSKNKITSK